MSTIRPAGEADAGALAAIYNAYVRDTTVTFEEVEIEAGQMAARIAAVTRAGLPWLVAELGTRVLGYACARPWHERSAYRFTVEISIYLAPGAGGRGHGSRLYAALFEKLRACGIRAAIACIALPNPASVALHEKFGLRPAGRLREAGFKFGRWIDVGYWQILL